MVLLGLAVSRAESRLGMREAVAGTAYTCLGSFRPGNPGWPGFRRNRRKNRMLHPSYRHLGFIFGYVNFSLYILKLKLIPGAAASWHSFCDLQHPPALSPGLLSLMFPSASCEDSPSQRNTGSKTRKISTALPRFPSQGTVTTGYCIYSCTK